MSGVGKAALHGLSCPRLEPALDRLLGLLGALARRLEETLQFPEGRRIELQITDESEVNARAFLDRDRAVYVIAFTRGMIVWADGMAATIAAWTARDFVAGPQAKLLVGDLARAGPEGLQAQLDHVTAWLPMDHTGFWESLLQKTCLSVFAHEASHIVRGHLDLQGDRLGLQPEMDELGLVRRRTVLSPSQVRLLEYDADTFAARLITHLALDPPAFLSRWRINTAQETLVEALLGSVLFSVALEWEEQARRERAPGYPRPLLRLLSMLIEMDRCWGRARKEEGFFAQVFPAALSVLGMLEETFPQIDAIRDLTDAEVLRATTQEAFAIVDELASFEQVIISHAFEGDGLWPAGRYA